MLKKVAIHIAEVFSKINRLHFILKMQQAGSDYPGDRVSTQDGWRCTEWVPGTLHAVTMASTKSVLLLCVGSLAIVREYMPLLLCVCWFAFYYHLF